MTAHEGLVVHIAEGYFEGTISWQKNPSADVSSHFIVGRSGQCAQMVDTSYKAWCQRAGNSRWLSVECEGFTLGHKLHRPGWEKLTAAQIDVIAHLLAKAHKVYGVPLVVTVKPTVRGLGYHSMGAENGADWGHSDCPGEPIKAQLPQIVARAKVILGIGTPVPTPTPQPTSWPANWTERIVNNLPTLRRGAKSTAVNRAQALINIYGVHSHLDEDGDFGPSTEAAVKAFQKVRGLLVDGVVGPATWSKLLGV